MNAKWLFLPYVSHFLNLDCAIALYSFGHQCSLVLLKTETIKLFPPNLCFKVSKLTQTVTTVSPFNVFKKKKNIFHVFIFVLLILPVADKKRKGENEADLFRPEWWRESDREQPGSLSTNRSSLFFFFFFGWGVWVGGGIKRLKNG